MLFLVNFTTGFFKKFRVTRERQGSIRMKFCVSGHWNSSIFIHYLKSARNKIMSNAVISYQQGSSKIK